MKKVYLFLLAIIFSALVLTGCTSPEPEEKETSTGEKMAEEKVANFPVTVEDALDEDVIIDKKPEKIISLIPSNTEIVYALGEGDAIVGVTDFDNYPDEVVKKEKIGGMEFNIEKVISLKPDLVLAHESTADSAKAGLQQMRDAGIDVVVINDAQSFEEVYTSIKLIGNSLGEQEKASELIDNMKSKFADLKKKAQTIEEPKTVFVEVSPEPEIYTAGKKTFIDELLGLIGAKNAAGEMEGWAKVDQEAIIDQNPDVIVTTYGYYTEKPIEQVLGRKGWNHVNAVKEKQIYDVHSDLVTRSGPRLAEGAEELAKAIYPDVYK